MKQCTDILIFSENIKTIRKDNNLSKVKMSEILGISTRTLTLIENGILPPKLSCDVLFRIYKNFGISPQSILSEIIKI